MSPHSRARIKLVPCLSHAYTFFNSQQQECNDWPCMTISLITVSSNQQQASSPAAGVAMPFSFLTQCMFVKQDFKDYAGANLGAIAWNPISLLWYRLIAGVGQQVPVNTIFRTIVSDELNGQQIARLQWFSCLRLQSLVIYMPSLHTSCLYRNLTSTKNINFKHPTGYYWTTVSQSTSWGHDVMGGSMKHRVQPVTNKGTMKRWSMSTNGHTQLWYAILLVDEIITTRKTVEGFPWLLFGLGHASTEKTRSRCCAPLPVLLASTQWNVQ